MDGEVIDPQRLPAVGELPQYAFVLGPAALDALGGCRTGAHLEELGQITGRMEDGEAAVPGVLQGAGCGQQVVQPAGRGDVGGDGEDSTQQIP
ncbi:hypothetical protein EDD90_6344 [Streptomyces sp. Ag109_O5-1]|uniref:hypothetical protein n=1 Tax=Streptomyces sp. Ag109_O5-1 TaxID=1938851 RepID=UPI000F4E3E84|nr:hypothetical protein [Streptomyces sp. Ag109_O5-1]RPE43157.1 hypothetical protein EDD90_6344 [Streptomyces sp. Ag109_O5-1]